MRKAAIQWIAVLTAALLVGPAAGALLALLRAPDGGVNATALVCDNPGLGVAALLGAMALAAIAGVASGWAGGAGLGFTCAGIVLVWGAVRSGRFEAIVRRTQDDSALLPLAIEGLFTCALAALLGLIICRMSRAPRTGSSRHTVSTRVPIDWVQAAQAVGACALMSAFIAWLVARTGLAGQTIGAAAAGALCGAGLGRFIYPSAPAWFFIAAQALPALIGPLVARFMAGGELVAKVYSGTEVPLARIMPLDWVAGAFIGVPIGLSWAVSLTEQVPGAGGGSAKGAAPLVPLGGQQN